MKVIFPTASAAVDRMMEAGILRESSGKRRGRLFLSGSYLDILNQGILARKAPKRFVLIFHKPMIRSFERRKAAYLAFC